MHYSRAHFSSDGKKNAEMTLVSKSTPQVLENIVVLKNVLRKYLEARRPTLEYVPTSDLCLINN